MLFHKLKFDILSSICYSIGERQVGMLKVRNMALCALFAALLALCAWLSIPAGDVAFTLQTLGVALTLWLLGGKRGSLAILIYLLLGAVGLPVFSGFQGGIGTLLNMTGGYIFGFLVWGLLYWLLTVIFPSSEKIKITAMVLGLLACYAFGSVWFYQVYLNTGAAISFGLVLMKCVFPYLLPDAVKLVLAFLLTRRLKRFVY